MGGVGGLLLFGLLPLIPQSPGPQEPSGFVFGSWGLWQRSAGRFLMATPHVFGGFHLVPLTLHLARVLSTQLSL